MEGIIVVIASVALCAMGMGIAFSSLGYAPILGYIIAGIITGPSGFGLVSNREAAEVFAEMGIIFLLFVIGAELSFDRIKNIWKRSVAVTVISMLCIFVLMFAFGMLVKIKLPQILLFTFCVTLSSTAVTVKSLESLTDRDESIEENTFGILIAQDLIALLMVLVLNFFGNSNTESGNKVHNIATMVAFGICIALYFTRYHKYIYKFTSFIRKHKDMMALSVFGMCLGGALVAEIAGLSASFGAFLVGLILGNSDLASEVKATAEPIEELLLMTFFLNVGFLVDLSFIWNNIWVIIFSLIFVTVFKTVINVFVLRLCRFSLKESFVISVLLGHIGEFAFMLTYTAMKLEIISIYGLKLLISLTALSLFMSPFWLKFAERCKDMANNAAVSSAWEFFRMASEKESRTFHKIAGAVTSGVKKSSMLVYNEYKTLFRINHEKK